MECKMTTINPVSQNLGAALRRARRLQYLPHDEAARLLKITTTQLAAYENGYAEIPKNILELLFSQGFAMIRSRYIHTQYMEFAKKLQELGVLTEMSKNYPIPDNN